MKNRLPVATIEIFHDRDTGVQDCDDVLEGIEIINAVTGGIEVIRATRQIRIAKPEAATVQPKRVNWPNLPADVNIILTEREIVGPEVPEHLKEPGFTFTMVGLALRPRGINIAVINSTHSTLNSTAAHEISHLFDMKRHGKTYDKENPGHCTDETCVMHACAEERSTDLLQGLHREFARSDFGVLRKMMGFDKPSTFDRKQHSPQFCDECTDQLAHQGRLRALAKLPK